jgi:hypothetical protein
MLKKEIIILLLTFVIILFLYGLMLFSRKNNLPTTPHIHKIHPNTKFIDLGCNIPNILCGNNCVSLGTDENCKKCGDTCPEGTFCKYGECFCKNGNQYPFNSSMNCGKCGNECQGGSTCNSGRCVCPDYQLLNNNNNCGTCGNVCQSGTICKDGVCV